MLWRLHHDKEYSQTLSVTKANRQLVGRSRRRHISRYVGNFADKPSSLVSVKSRLSVQLGSSHTWQHPAQKAINCESLVAQTNIRVTEYQSEAASYIGLQQSLYQVAQKQDTKFQLQKASEYDPISFRSSISKGRFCQAPNTTEANSYSRGQDLHSTSCIMISVESHIQPA